MKLNMDVKCEDVNIIVQNLIDYCNGTNACSPSIYMAPSTIRKLIPSSFKPRVVSIGPLHREDENLQQFEGRKATFVQRLLVDTAFKKYQTATQILTACVQKVAASIKRIKTCYADIKGYSDLELTEMMVKDASFILQFILEISDLDESSMFMSLDNYIYYDLVLLENQIPFFVLNYIFECTILQFEKHQSLTEFILPLLRHPNLFQTKVKPVTSRSYTKYDHILGYLHDCYKPRYNIPSCFPKSTIHLAVELDRAGVKFRPIKNATSFKLNKNAIWPLAIKVKMNMCSCIFWFLSKPTLRMPTLRINHFTELVFRNLIAYEQSSTVRAYVTSYAKAMDMLVDTQEDIAKLVRSKVIINHLGSNEEAANMINGICKEVVWEDFFYGNEWETLGSHFIGYWPRKVVNLRRTYFNSPWSIIALFAGIALFALAVVQTIFAVKSAGN